MERLRTLDFSQIRGLLPHGHPMVLVDRVLSIEPGDSIISIKAITGSEPCYGDLALDLHPNRYAYPTSLLIESFGQTAAILWLTSVHTRNGDGDKVFMITTARNCRIEGHIAHIDNLVGDNVFVSGETWVGDRRIASMGSMIATQRPRFVVIDRAISHGAPSISVDQSGSTPIPCMSVSRGG
jgi:3-hydroxyacyl-[acyl-carrier-protein] dehydratase